MEYLSFKEEICNTTIKCLKKSVTGQRAITYLNAAIALFNGYVIYHQDPANWFTALCTGAIIGNVIWCATALHSFKYDLKMEKEYLRRIKELQNDAEYQDSLKQMRRAKEHYDDFIRYEKIKDNIHNVSPKNKQQESAFMVDGFEPGYDIPH